MTRYDPFTYGEVKLDGETDSGKQLSEDLLFEGAGPAPQSEPEEDASDWAALDDSSDAMLPGVDVAEMSASMGAGAIDGSALQSAQSQGGPAAAESASTTSQQMQRVDADQSGATGCSGNSQPLRHRKLKAISARQLPYRPPPTRPLGMLVPPLVLVVGGGVGAFFYTQEQNVIMAGLIAAATVTAACFTRVLFR